ncbi:uncharacterized protein LOC133814280 [Humulus lupulus]|uniref:uncharacterized protein LOC133814280 n=1 Tax=Humulus lupulus TaxID=3486 RepID=UPI002B4047D3|nr:uncharacterized protein LOC133814280 [Humulus lupulus]
MVKSVPVWIRLNGLGLQYWGKNSLSALVSTIGKPIMVDKVTQSRAMVIYARVLVDMEISDHPPKIIAYINEQGQLVEQMVEYEWLPSKCVACAQLGHIVANCNKGNENRVHNATITDADDRGERLYMGFESKESKQGTHISTQLDGTGRNDSAGNWITPKRRGPKQEVAAHHKAAVAPSKANSRWNVRGMNKKEKQKAILDVCKENKDYFSSSITSGRILVIWQAKFVKVDILLEDPQLVHCKIKVCGQQEVFFATVVYGSNSMEERKILWDKLANISHLNNPWIIFGDFNAMFSFQDRNGGRQILAKDIVDAQDWLALGQVEEFKCSGAHFTWSNKHDIGDQIFSKLDRVFTNVSWLDLFPKTEACFKCDCVSDHSCCIIESQELNKVGIKPFRFCNHWLHYRRFKETVLESWNSTSGSGRGLNQIVQKLFRVKHVLKRFKREEVGDVVLDYKLAKEELSNAQEALATNPSDHTMHQAVIQVQQKFTVMQNRYSSFLKQQSKVNWVVFSDDNSKYFHAVMRKRRIENRITSFTTGDKIEDDYEKVVKHFLSHFENFMGRSSSATKEMDLECLNQGNRLTMEQQVRLLRPFSKNDVKKALFSIHSSKSPGLDGFGSSFFKGLWGNIGAKISQAVLDFFQDGFLPKTMNETVISLIPKVADPKSASDYRPIACFNTLYKCISKLLCTRLSEVLPFLVHSNQGAFIKNRSLAHNIMIFQDLLKGYTRKNISARCIMKIDLSKAYDTVDWHFVEELLKNLYDLIIFCKGNINSVRGIQEAFKKLCDSAGLSANKAKSHIFFGGVKEEIKIKILGLMQMEEGSFPLKYLGVHLQPTKWKASDYGVILDKLNKNLNYWASRNLSFASRAQLIHSVMLGIRNFWMSIFILPYKVTAALDKCCRDFLWGSKGSRSKLHLPSWEKVFLPKKLGGIGFREGKKWNMALMAKFIWASSRKQDCLWVRWINSIYLKDHNIWSIPIKQDMSWYFKKLLRLRNKCIFDSVCNSARSVSFEIRKVVKCRILGMGLHIFSKKDRYLLNVVKGW